MKAFERFAPLFMLWVSGFGLGIFEPIVAPKEWHAVADDYIVDITDHEPSNEARQTCAKWAKGGRRFLCTNNAAKE